MDAVVAGGGPAGCAAAIVLATAGWRVTVFARPLEGDRAGESLSPAAIAMLSRLALRERFLADGHRACHANASAWGRDALVWHDFLGDPRGPGFHLDRARFDALLRARAIEAGVRWIATAAPPVERAGDGWRVGALSARFVIDASGRGSKIARGLGARRRVAWPQVALVGFLRAARPRDESFTLIEAVPDGFWYSAPIPGDRLAVAWFTDADLHDPRRARAGFDRLLAPRTRDRLAAHAATAEAAPRFVGAGSGWLEPVHGPGWIAAGDAALTYDPISAHGITLALRTGIDAADALLAGDAAGYAARLARGFADYRAAALQIYRAEQRWPTAPYWRRRHAL